MVKGDDNMRKRNLWTEEEDKMLVDYVNTHGERRWNKIPIETGLRRCRKSCRLRWINYLSPNVKRGDFTEDEDDLIIRLHKLLGNRWALIAGRVPGRTDNQVKNHWNTILSKQLGLKNKKNKTIRDVTSSTYSSPSSQPIMETKECIETRGIRNETCNYNDFLDLVGGVREDNSNNFEINYESISTPYMMEFFEGFPLDLDDWNKL